MVYINKVEIEIREQKTPVEHLKRGRSLNDSIAILLRSYTRAINRREKRTGSLFQNRTKAICITKVDEVARSWFSTNHGTLINILDSEKQYAEVLFNYIHQNPVKNKLVKRMEDWEYSSCKDVLGIRSGKLVNRERIKELGLRIH